LPHAVEDRHIFREDIAVDGTSEHGVQAHHEYDVPSEESHGEELVQLAFGQWLLPVNHGNLYMNQSEIPEPIINPENNEEMRKNVFVIFAHGKEIISKIRKISESLGADLYSVDEDSQPRSILNRHLSLPLRRHVR